MAYMQAIFRLYLILFYTKEQQVSTFNVRKYTTNDFYFLFTVTEFGHPSISGQSVGITGYQDIRQGLGLVYCKFEYGEK